MKKTAVLLVLWVSFLSLDAHARSGVQYFLPKATAMFFDGNPERDKPLYTVGLVYGHAFDTSIALEIDGNYGIYGGDYTEDGNNGSYSYWDAGIYGVYRYPVLVEGYLKGKAGAAYSKIDHVAAVGSSKSREGTEVVLGAGFGYVFKSSITFELEYTRLKNNSHNLGLGLHYQF